MVLSESKPEAKVERKVRVESFTPGDPFFAVFRVYPVNPQGRHYAPTVKWASQEAAEAEAQRLAKKYPGSCFTVLETLSHFYGPEGEQEPHRADEKKQGQVKNKEAKQAAATPLEKPKGERRRVRAERPGDAWKGRS